jgi:quercetin dioxygenase-like cupin family protein
MIRRPWIHGIVRKEAMRPIAAVLLGFCFASGCWAQNPPSRIERQVLLQSTGSWDGTAYKKYPVGQPQLTVLKITIQPHTTMDWHSHALPNAAYILSGTLTIEGRDGGGKKRLVTGDAVAEMIDRQHRGVTGDEPVVLIVFYAGVPGMPLSH